MKRIPVIVTDAVTMLAEAALGNNNVSVKATGFNATGRAMRLAVVSCNYSLNNTQVNILFIYFAA